MAIHIALAKGRIHKVVMKYLKESGYDFPTYTEESRKLIFEDASGSLKVTLVKSPDVAVYVERGAADIGIVGEDVLIEDNGVRTSQSRHIECFAGCHEGEGILRGSPRNSSKRMVFVRWQSQVGMNFIGDDKRMAFRTNISNPA